MLDERSGSDEVVRSRGARVGLAVGLGLLAVAALWAGFTGAGPAQLDGPALAESIEDRNAGLTGVAVVITTVGSTVAMAVLAVAVGAWCWWRGRHVDAVLAVGAMAGASLLFRLLKLVLERARPPIADHAVAVSSESLPSGHATMSTVVIGTIVVLAWSGRSVGERTAMVLAAALCVGAVGATRVYLGVHWLSDVLAGWPVGAAWLAVCVLLWTRWRAREPRAREGAEKLRP
ncbi:MAG: phosphatase PAP2 family protein [Pseudonocardiales bacterium]|nr:phosphatase PAP2 family protein [Pseudonocardiales bacterium]